MAEWMTLSSGVVHPWHHDQFGHMNVRHYAPFFDDASMLIWTRIGIPFPRMVERHGIHCVTAKAVTTFRRELTAGDSFRIEGAVVRLGRKSVTFGLRMRHTETGELHASYETTEVAFDPAARRAAEMPAEVRDALARHLVSDDAA